MDPFTHVVVGRAVVAAARRETKNHLVGAAAILGALAPDVDAVLALSGWDRYVRAHQYGTHSLAGALIVAAAAAAVVERSAGVFALRSARRATAAERAAKPSGERSDQPSPTFATLFAAAAAGALSHILLDLLAGARIAVGWPIVAGRVSLPMVAMFDPWFIAICTSWLVMLWPLRVTLPRASRMLVSALAVFICVKAALLGVALRRSGAVLERATAIEARWATLTEWFVFDRSAERLRTSAISSRGGPPAMIMFRDIAPETRLVHASRALEDVQNFLAVHEFAFPDETRDGAGRVSVLWSDLRYCWPAADRGRWQPATHCGVQVGGRFDAAGRAILQEVRVGGMVQRRPP